jgi:hypothetical protein
MSIDSVHPDEVMEVDIFDKIEHRRFRKISRRIAKKCNLGLYIKDYVVGSSTRENLLKLLGSKYRKLDELTKYVLASSTPELKFQYIVLKGQIHHS